VDSLSLFSIILPAKTCGADETARLLFDHLFMMFGVRTLISDRGSVFKSRLLKALCALLGSKQKFTSSTVQTVELKVSIKHSEQSAYEM